MPDGSRNPNFAKFLTNGSVQMQTIGNVTFANFSPYVNSVKVAGVVLNMENTLQVWFSDVESRKQTSQSHPVMFGTYECGTPFVQFVGMANPGGPYTSNDGGRSVSRTFSSLEHLVNEMEYLIMGLTKEVGIIDFLKDEPLYQDFLKRYGLTGIKHEYVGVDGMKSRARIAAKASGF